jgi:hypothetical protein
MVKFREVFGRTAYVLCSTLIHIFICLYRIYDFLITRLLLYDNLLMFGFCIFVLYFVYFVFLYCFLYCFTFRI